MNKFIRVISKRSSWNLMLQRVRPVCYTTSLVVRLYFHWFAILHMYTVREMSNKFICVIDRILFWAETKSEYSPTYKSFQNMQNSCRTDLQSAESDKTEGWDGFWSGDYSHCGLALYHALFSVLLQHVTLIWWAISNHLFNGSKPISALSFVWLSWMNYISCRQCNMPKDWQ